MAKASNILIELRRRGVKSPTAVAEKIRKMRYDASRRGLKFDLSDSTLCTVITSNCHYCNYPGPNGLDRINSKKAYVKGNVVACCTYCNRAKSDMTMVEFKVWLETAYKFFIKRAA